MQKLPPFTSDSGNETFPHIPESLLLAILRPSERKQYEVFSYGKSCFLLSDGDWGVFYEDYLQFLELLPGPPPRHS